METDGVLSPIEGVLASIPGCNTPLGRIAVFGGAGAAFAYGVKPSMSFNPDGTPKPWILFDALNPNATLMPHWMWGVLPAFIFGVLV
jgi:hypothetical protein